MAEMQYALYKEFSLLVSDFCCPVYILPPFKNGNAIEPNNSKTAEESNIQSEQNPANSDRSGDIGIVHESSERFPGIPENASITKGIMMVENAERPTFVDGNIDSDEGREPEELDQHTADGDNCENNESDRNSRSSMLNNGMVPDISESVLDNNSFDKIDDISAESIRTCSSAFENAFSDFEEFMLDNLDSEDFGLLSVSPDIGNKSELSIDKVGDGVNSTDTKDTINSISAEEHVKGFIHGEGTYPRDDIPKTETSNLDKDMITQDVNSEATNENITSKAKACHDSLDEDSGLDSDKSNSTFKGVEDASAHTYSIETKREEDVINKGTMDLHVVQKDESMSGSHVVVGGSNSQGVDGVSDGTEDMNTEHSECLIISTELSTDIKHSLDDVSEAVEPSSTAAATNNLPDEIIKDADFDNTSDCQMCEEETSASVTGNPSAVEETTFASNMDEEMSLHDKPSLDLSLDLTAKLDQERFDTGGTNTDCDKPISLLTENDAEAENPSEISRFINYPDNDPELYRKVDIVVKEIHSSLGR